MNNCNVEIKVAENCGFCFGVRRAVKKVYELRRSTDKKIYIIGELIHNEIFIKRLENDGIYCIDENDIDTITEPKDKVLLVIRTHGVTKALNDKLLDSGFDIVDATCPFVKRIHKIVEENSDASGCTIIVGDKKHPEVKGIQSYAKGETVICSDDTECCDFVNNRGHSLSENVLLVSQTTGNNEKYLNCQKVIKKVFTKAKIFDTICSVTENRQNEVKNLSQTADIMCIIGCTKSSNTKKLYEIASEVCNHTYLIETAEDVPENEFIKLYKEFEKKLEKQKKAQHFTVGITAGASTPDDIIEEVKVRVEKILH